MKRYLYLPLLLLSFSALGQQARTAAGRQQSAAGGKCPRVYLGLSTGINNNNGLLGVNADVAVTPAFSIGGGAGLSSWGYKVFGEARYYFSPCNRGWALSGALTYATGGRDVTINTETRNGTDQEVRLDLAPKTNLALSGYRFWTLGRAYNRIFLQFGWSVPLTETSYEVKNGYQLSDASDKALRLTSPGGLIIGFGLSFGLGD